MDIEKTERLLHKFDFNFKKINRILIVKLDFSQRIIIDFSDSEKVKIKDRLVGWNFLTGFLDMNIKNAMLFNFIGAIIMTFLLVYFDLEYGGLNLVFFFLAFIFWVVLWSIFYLIKAENLKRILTSWNE